MVEIEVAIERSIRLGQRVLALPWVPFVGMVLILTIWRSGLRFPWTPDTPFFGVIENWPSGSSWDSSIGWLLPAKIGLTSPLAWGLAWIAVAAATAVFVMWRIQRILPGIGGRLFVLSLAASSIPIVLTSSLGSYDELFICGSFILVLGGKRLWVLGGAIIAISNPEMGLVASIAAGSVSWALANTSDIRQMTITASMCAGVAICVFSLENLLGRGAADGRVLLLGRNLQHSVAGNAAWLPLTLATMYLSAWLVLLFICLGVRDSLHLAAAVLGLAVIPLLAALFTLDGTRVAVVTSSAAFLIAIREWCKGYALEANSRGTAIIALSLSILIIATPGLLVAPFNPAQMSIPPFEGLVRLSLLLRG